MASHIPQPAAGAPDEVFDSVSSQAVQNVVSGLGIPAGPPQEIPIHTGQMNGFDPAIHRQWVPTDTFVWSVTQSSGTMLWKRPVHPSYANPLLAYLSGIYNTWGGNIDYRFKVAGTGFHAGAIAIVRIPPNRNPEEFTTPTAWGAFEYMVIDPKTLETESVGVSDQRPIAFHYFPFRQEDALSFGGWIAIYVLIPLNTSATGSQQIAIQAFSKPGDNFQYSQLIMPAKNTVSTPFPPEFNTYFDNFHLSSLTTAPLLTTKMVIEPKDIIETTFSTNCYSITGEYLSKWLRDPKSGASIGYSTWDQPLIMDMYNSEKEAEFFFYRDYMSIWMPTNKSHIGVTTISDTKEATAETWNTKNITANFSDTYASWGFESKATFLPDKSVNRLTFTNGTVMATPDNAFAPAVNGESLIHFMNDTTKVKSIQNRRLTELFKSGLLRDLLYSNVCALFTMVSKDEELPLGQVKLYKEGFFTARSTSEAINLNANNVRFEFAGFILRTDPIPGNVEYAKNMIMMRALSRQKPSRH